MKHTILSISGKPGLYKLVSNGKASLIVETLDEKHKRMPIFASDRVTSLNDIAMYTEGEDVPLTTILGNLYKEENGNISSLDYKKCKPSELREYFTKILPNFDKERVHDSDIKKLIQWYNILVKNDITDFEEQSGNDINGKDEKEG